MKDCGEEGESTDAMACCATTTPSPAVLAFADSKAKAPIGSLAVHPATDTAVQLPLNPVSILQIGFQGNSPPVGTSGLRQPLRI
jgi:hypothetical protein